jgi:hypothetical protein
VHHAGRHALWIEHEMVLMRASLLQSAAGTAFETHAVPVAVQCDGHGSIVRIYIVCSKRPLVLPVLSNGDLGAAAAPVYLF